MNTLLKLSLFVGVCLAYACALPFFGNTHRDFRGGLVVDGGAPNEFGAAPQDQAQGNTVYVSSSASDYDSTPSDGGGDTNPLAPTAGPGGNPTQAAGAGGPVLISEVSVPGMTAGIVIGLAVVVGIAVAVAIYVIKKKG